MKSDIIARVRNELKKNIDKHAREGFQRFFKEDVKVYGVRSSVLGKITRKYFQEIKGLNKKEIFDLCEELLKSDYSEEAFIAHEWAYRQEKEYTPADFKVFERWVRKYVNNWAKCDSLCNHAIGSLVERYPQNLQNLKAWAHSKNRWVKRAAAVTLILPARRGKFLDTVFELADILLLDRDDLVQKGYGWMLKEASRQHPKEVLEYLIKHRKVIPRTAFRYALEKMPARLRTQAMAQ